MAEMTSTASVETVHAMHNTSGMHLGSEAMSVLLTPGDTFGSERFRGLVMSAISGVTANLLNFAGMKYLGLSVQVSSVLFLQVLGNILGYVLDILFAKRTFKIRNYRGSGNVYDGPLPYRDVVSRFKWLVRSFISKQFYRFLVTVIIDTLVSLALLNWSIKAMDAKHILTDFKYRNFALASLIAVGTFFLYVNILRFDWAYSDDDMPIFNVIILMWVTLVLMLYAVTYNPTASPAKLKPAAQASDQEAQGVSTKSGILTAEPPAQQVSNKFSPVFSTL